MIRPPDAAQRMSGALLIRGPAPLGQGRVRVKRGRQLFGIKQKSLDWFEHCRFSPKADICDRRPLYDMPILTLLRAQNSASFKG